MAKKHSTICSYLSTAYKILCKCSETTAKDYLFALDILVTRPIVQQQHSETRNLRRHPLLSILVLTGAHSSNELTNRIDNIKEQLTASRMMDTEFGAGELLGIFGGLAFLFAVGVLVDGWDAAVNFSAIFDTFDR